MTSRKRVATGVDHPLKYSLEADHHLGKVVEGFGDAYLDAIAHSILNQPRTLQKRIGPSEIGVPCTRSILHKLNGDPEQERGIPWKPTIGTAVHAYLEEAFAAKSAQGEPEEGRWLIEQKVTVGTVAGQEISGHTDLYDAWLYGVVDHKIVGNYTGKKYRANGPSEQYRVQAHLYGKGHENAGRRVDWVAICFLPREGELDGDTFIWSEPYDATIADAALDRLAALAAFLDAVGIDAALAAYPPCTETFCRWCGTGTSWPQRPTPKATADLFGSAPKSSEIPSESTTPTPKGSAAT